MFLSKNLHSRKEKIWKENLDVYSQFDIFPFFANEVLPVVGHQVQVRKGTLTCYILNTLQIKYKSFTHPWLWGRDGDIRILRRYLVLRQLVSKRRHGNPSQPQPLTRGECGCLGPRRRRVSCKFTFRATLTGFLLPIPSQSPLDSAPQPSECGALALQQKEARIKGSLAVTAAFA